MSDHSDDQLDEFLFDLTLDPELPPEVRRAHDLAQYLSEVQRTVSELMAKSVDAHAGNTGTP